MPFVERNKERLIPQFWPILIIMFAFLSLLQLGGMQFYLLHSGNVVWPTSIADCSVRFCGVSLRLAVSPQDWLGLFCPQNPQHMWIAPALWDGKSACLHTHIYDILSCAHSHVNNSIHIQEVQKRGYFVPGLLCSYKTKKWMLQRNLKLDLRIATVRNNYSAFTNTTKSNLDKNDSQRTTNNHLFFTLKYI